MNELKNGVEESARSRKKSKKKNEKECMCEKQLDVETPCPVYRDGGTMNLPVTFLCEGRCFIPHQISMTPRKVGARVIFFADSTTPLNIF